MRFRITTWLVLAAIMLQSVFAGLQGSIVICLGGVHEHEQVAATEQCEWGCSHHDELVTPSFDEEHIANCDCTDIELGLVTLLRTTRGVDHDLQVALAAPVEIGSIQHDDLKATSALMRGPPGIVDDDPGIRHRLDVVRMTRLLI